MAPTIRGGFLGGLRGGLVEEVFVFGGKPQEHTHNQIKPTKELRCLIVVLLAALGSVKNPWPAEIYQSLIQDKP